ncbi:alpha/beta fold hydrolase [Microbacterium murale]|uniref:Pimeloyl-ACP methyl ester carboxylesterase n=1 Tax=Microbacterium murale TaxID=1081040 RepID=A0ABU0P906_9MICO|nr:alpha/beta hydrolase [Microbacterium murale]MDQ0643166.1 pimeloyl-ACP methyl ester carboxylesterase [Microbacterium murale]
MDHATSADGTLIAMHEVGAGPTVVIVNGALSTARDATEVAHAFAEAGLRTITYDRRARGDSGDSALAAPEREVEDLAAVVAASGTDAAVIGHSSGAILALYAAGEGVPMSRLFLSEPPFRFGEGDPAEDLEDRLQAFVDDGHPEEAVVLFQREAVGLPESFIEQFRASPAFAQISRLGRSTIYDTLVTRRVSTPSTEMLGVRMPVTILCGDETMPILVTAASRLAEMMPHAEFLQVSESVGHRMDPAATARIVAARIAG